MSNDGTDNSRRRFLLGSAALVSLAACHARIPSGQQKMSRDPFQLGVASGDPLADGFVLWTRLAPDPLHGGGMDPHPVAVYWEVATDAAFGQVVAQGTTRADPEWAHSVHVEVHGLRPDRWYFYRFRAGGAVSPVGRTRTAPILMDPLARLDIAFASCQHYEQGYFNALRAMAEDQPDLILFLGDYIYESSWGRSVRRHEAGEPQTLAEYRNRYARYKGDPDLQAAHATCPWLVTWDDHEVEDDYADELSQGRVDPARFLKRRAAAYQAYWEHMPLRPRARPHGPDMRLYQRSGFGDLLSFYVLDNRQYRDDQPCGTPENGGGRILKHCPERTDPDRSMLGEVQERWLMEELGHAPARWNVLAQSQLMAPFDYKSGQGDVRWSDGWDGYSAARQRILDRLVEADVANPVVIGGDIHSFWANDLKRDFSDPASPVVASEFVGTSVTSDGPDYDTYRALLPENPHVKFFDSRYRGYVRCRITPQSWESDFRVVDILQPRAKARTMRSFRVEAGQPGIQPA